ncbi:MAG: hypothetical protein JSW71_00535 [Gemmatimonadota bacterium]|nr:MAG: hypothetical protein JSW71_00535 [Gemmatimonadota bacterium]
MRHEAAPGTIVRTAFQTVTVLWAFDRRRFESADIGTASATFLRGLGGKTVVHLAYDSVRTRTRGSDGSWREFLMPVDSAWVQVSVDDRFRVSGRNEGRQPVGVTGLMRILTGLPNLELPGSRLNEGDGWSSKTAASVVPGLRNETVPPVVDGTVEIVLDSIVARARDTLGFLSVAGQFPPTTFVDAMGPGRVTASGDVVGSLIWSTSWNGFVSGVSKTRMTVVRAAVDGTTGAGEELRVEATTRHHVIP